MSAAFAFLIGLVVGCNVGVFVIGLCRAAANSDREEGGTA
jgi:uncharacterized membrane protein